MSWFHTVRRGALATAVGGGIAIAALTAGAGSATARTVHRQRDATHAHKATPAATGGQSIVANYTSGGLLNVKFNAALAAGAAPTSATGTFSAQLSLANNAVGSLAGPVTCLDVVGSDIGLFYPVTSSSPSALGAVMKGVYVSLQVGAKGQPQSFSFKPSLTATTSSCAPLPGLVPITSGTVTFGS